MTCIDLFEQGYEDKAKRILAKHQIKVKSLQEVNEIVKKTKAKIEKVKMAAEKKKKDGKGL